MNTVTEELQVDRKLLTKEQKYQLNLAKKRQETLDKNKAKAEKAKLILSGKIPKQEVDEEYLKVQQMFQLYEELCSTYSSTMVNKGKVLRGSQTYRNWLSVVRIADEHSIPYDLYLKANFWYLDKISQKIPTLRDLNLKNTKVPCVARVLAYLEAVEKGKIKETTNIVSRVIKSEPVPEHVQSRHCERQLAAFMNNLDLSEEEVYMKFARSNNYNLYFNKEWLATKKVYVKLQQAGKLD